MHPLNKRLYIIHGCLLGRIMMMLICAVFIFKLRHPSHRNYFSDRIQMMLVVITVILHISSNLNTYNTELIKEDMTASKMTH